jgi:D-glycero-D-manno-heptose 1,7-bisphosphate phosphatase
LAEPAPRPAAFLDRDGTIIRDTGYLHDPAAVELLPGAAAAIRRFRDAGWAVVVVSNQSGIARGLYPEAAYHAVQARLAELLAAAGARMDAAYFCPHHPEITGPCECRKPGIRLFEQAAREHHLDLGRSIWVGDRPSDVEPARHWGGRAFLVRTGQGSRHVEAARVLGVPVVDDLTAVAAGCAVRGGFAD